MHNFLMNKFNVYHEADTGSNGGDGGQGGSGGEPGSDEGSEKGETDKGIMIPKSRFDEVNDNYKSIKAELDALKDTQTQAEKDADEQAKKDAEAKGEFESLYTDAQSKVDTLTKEKETAAERVGVLEGIINGLLESKLETIDKEYHDLIPESMTAEQKLSWVTAAESKGVFGSKGKENEPLGKQTNGKGSQSMDIEQLSPMQLMMNGYADK